MIQLNPVNTESEGVIKSVHIEQVEFRENLVRAFFRQGILGRQSVLNKVSVLSRCLTVTGTLFRAHVTMLVIIIGAQLFEGRLALNLGLNLTLVSFSCVQKH